MGSAPPASNDGTLRRPAAQEGGNAVDVAIAGDRTVYVGIVAAVASVFATTPQARVWVVVPKGETGGLREALACGGRAVRVVEFDDAVLVNLTIQAPTGPGYGNLKSSLNFARFYLAELLPSVRRVVYLDADVVVLRDLAALFDDHTATAVAAVPRPKMRPCYNKNASRPGMFFCDDPKARAVFRSNGIDDPDEQLSAFNAGVAAFDLDVWRERGLRQRAEFWIRAHATTRLWRLGSNPPLVLVAAGSFRPLDTRWNCDGLGWKRTLDLDPACLRHGAFVWHWSGPRKPWLEAGLFKHLWWPHIHDASCLPLLRRR